MGEIKTKFKSCMDGDNLLVEKVTLKNPDGKEVGWVEMTPLSQRQSINMVYPKDLPPKEFVAWVDEKVFNSIKAWSFDCPVTLENLKKMELSIVDALFGVLLGISQVSDTTEKNSESS